MEFEDKKDCPIVKVDGFVEKGKQFDLEINIPEDNRNVIYGVIKDCYKEPVEDAVVKLIEIFEDYGKKERRPVSHTFTDKNGEFVFGPLCPDKSYEVQIWADKVRHFKICAEGKHQGKCLKGVKIDCRERDWKKDYKEDYEEDYKKEYKDDYKDEYKKDCKCDYKDEYKKDYKDDYKDEYEKDCKCDHKDEYKKDCKCDYKDEYKKDCKCDYKDEYKKDCKNEYEKDHKDNSKDEHKKDCKADCKCENKKY